MTPDELPADMEAVVARADILYAGKGPLAVTRTTTLRALLKAYQERGRAFRSLFESISCVEGDGGRRSYGFNPSFWKAYREAEATLNQKGDER